MDVLQQLNSVQKKVVESAAGPTLVLAGAGSGKTRVLTHRIAYLISSQQASPEQILAVTFTNKAAGEMRERLIKLLGKPVVNSVWRQNTGPMIGTFHSVCARILREDIAALGLGYTSSFTIYDQSDQLRAIRQILKELHISTQEFSPKAILGMIGRAKIELLSPDKFREHQAEQSPVYKVAAQVYERYQKFLIKSNALDFSDLLFRTVELWQNHEQILKKHQSRWPFVLVDEYQDTNQTQYTFCQLLTKAKRNLFVVGDDCQSIYGFRGANLENILNFTKDYPKASKFLLEQNYRSTKSILDLANIIIKKNKRQQVKTLWTDNNAGIPPQIVEVDDEVSEAEFVLREIGRSASLDTQNSELEAEDVGYEYDEEDHDDDVPFTGTGILDRVMAVNRGRHGYGEAVNPVKIIRDLSSRVNLNDYVVLYRTNAQSRALEEVMLRWGVPYQIVGGVRFYDRKEIKDVIAYLRVLHNPRDLVSLERIINTPLRGIGPKTWQEFVVLMNNHDFDFKRVVIFLGSRELSGAYKKLLPFCRMMIGLMDGMSSLSVSEIIKQVVTQSGYINHLKKSEVNFQEREENIKELQTVAERFAEDSEDQALTKFLEEVALVSDIDRLENNQNSLTLMTVHAAKGLEYPRVFIIGMEQGLFPHASSLMNPAELEEERRLCYVGITRARERLHLIHTRQRHLYGSTIFPEPSEFIVDLGDDVVERQVY